MTDAEIEALIDAARRWKTHSGAQRPRLAVPGTVEVVYPAGDTQRWTYDTLLTDTPGEPDWDHVIAWRYVVD